MTRQPHPGWLGQHHDVDPTVVQLTSRRDITEIVPTDETAVEPQVAEPIRLILTIEQAARRLGIGRTLMYRLVMSGEVESVMIGRLRRVPAECLAEYVASLRTPNQSTRPAA